MRKPNEYLTAYKIAVKEHKLNIDFLAKLHQLKRSTIGKYIYENNRNPSFVVIFELHSFLRNSQKNVPRELGRIISRHYMRGYQTAKRIKKNLQKEKNEK